MNARDIVQMRVVSKEFDDTQRYGPCGDLFFFLLRRETEPIDAIPTLTDEHVSTERFFSHVQPEGVFLPERNDPLCQGSLEVSARQNPVTAQKQSTFGEHSSSQACQ